MKSICKGLGYGIIGFGSLASIFMAYSMGTTITEGRWGMEIVRSWPLTILYFLVGLFVTAVWAAILLGIAEIIEYLEAVKEVRTEVPVGQISDSEDALSRLAAEQPAAETFWKCPACGKNNPPYTGTCSCGQSKE